MSVDQRFLKFKEHKRDGFSSKVVSGISNRGQRAKAIGSIKWLRKIIHEQGRQLKIFILFDYFGYLFEFYVAAKVIVI